MPNHKIKTLQEMLQLARGGILVKLRESLGNCNFPELLRGARTMANAAIANGKAKALASGKYVWDILLSEPLL